MVSLPHRFCLFRSCGCRNRGLHRSGKAPMLRSWPCF